MKNYDVIVIGAGNGGLAAAATCAKAGLSTLLLERHNIPGGSASSFVRGRFEFEPSLHELAGVGAPDKSGQIEDMFIRMEGNVQPYTVVDGAYGILDGHLHRARYRFRRDSGKAQGAGGG